MKLKLFKTKDGYSRVKTEKLEEISTPVVLTETEEEPVAEQDGTQDAITGDVDDTVLDGSDDLSDAELEAKGVDTGILNTLRSLIQDEYEAIDGYNNAVQMLLELDKYEPVGEVLRHIMLEEYSHIGELQKCLAELDPEAFQNLDLGEEDAAEMLDLEPEEEDASDLVSGDDTEDTNESLETDAKEANKIFVNGEPYITFEKGTDQSEIDKIAYELKNILGTKEVRIVYEDGSTYNMKVEALDEALNLDEAAQLVVCPNCYEETFNDETGLCTSCGYDEKPEDDE